MTREDVLKGLQERFRDDIIDLYDRSHKRVYMEIIPDALPRVAMYIFRDLGARFNIASGTDTRTHIEILYHFSLEEINLIMSLRVKLDREKPSIASIAKLIKGANWIESEMYERLGIQFIGHPDLRRLLLADEWPRGVYPLRTDYEEWDKSAVRDRGV